MKTARVLDSKGRQLSPCSSHKARKLLAQGEAILICEVPLTIQLPYAVELPPRPQGTSQQKAGEGRSILLHTCCGPCATYTINRLREQGYEVSGFWYNPNIHPFTEHQRRLASMEAYAESVGLPLLSDEGYEMSEFLRAVVGREAHPERCRHCYAMRLGRTAKVAAGEGFDAFTTTLLISPHQDQDLLRETGEAAGAEYGVEFHFESFRRGWSERGRLTREHDLYRQQYCGCIYSEWERYSGHKITAEASALTEE
ncbi:MAG TPA: epoxyqueuosine reductase QueH [Anaerolineae bacterium]|nr:epoxyqueuosine reductase QueH [Anaerolineae bacterium]HUW95952.1 epoxyqueuosine reductase QueH [Anaerolineae bacterium]